MTLQAKLFTFLLFWIYSFSYGQMDQYRYARQLGETSREWHQVILPDEIFGKVRADLSDLRIYGITENRDTVEAPYLLRLKMDEVSDTEIESKIINAVQNENGYYFTFQVSSAEPINRINLDFGEDNYDWDIQLEGSHNQQEWFSILKDYRILSITNGLTDFQFSALTFPAASYSYFRLLIPSDKKPTLKKVALANEKYLEGTFNVFSIAETTTIQTKNKTTEIELTLENPVPVSRLRINVSDKFDFYRPVTVSYLVDSIETQQGWKENYRTLTTGTLNSIEENEFSFESRVLQKLKITVENQDNQVLTFTDFEVKGYVHELLVRFNQPADYYLVYGNELASRPRYDLVQFNDKIPEDLTELKVGDERQISNKQLTNAQPLFQNMAWLWSIMALIMVLLGWFTVRMMRSK
ncbi:DUF3999 family protein [Algoriphagus aquimarinus]|uniref:DUF3999 family protein n=1 Tax=Algoriphagus aquimarinus TaxID=237018 RepID=UPI0030DCD76E|tara:strand:+ start:34092 stop:35321 length:1230 start_codon:yes stop_codon:yes gene_type:complete